MADRFLPSLVTTLALTGLLELSPVADAQGRAYVANFGSNNVSVIDTASNTVIATVTVGNQPQGIAVTPDGARAYVANCGGDVVVIDTSSNKVAARVTVGGCPTGVAITPNGSRAYVTRDNANSVWVIDTSNNTVVAKVAVGIAPGGIAITPDGTRAYVANVGMGTGSVSVIDTSSNSVVATVSLGNVGPVGLPRLGLAKCCAVAGKFNEIGVRFHRIAHKCLDRKDQGVSRHSLNDKFVPMWVNIRDAMVVILVMQPVGSNRSF